MQHHCPISPHRPTRRGCLKGTVLRCFHSRLWLCKRNKKNIVQSFEKLLWKLLLKPHLSNATYVNMGFYNGQLCQHQHERDGKAQLELQSSFERKVEAWPFLQRDKRGKYENNRVLYICCEMPMRIIYNNLVRRCKANLVRCCLCKDHNLKKKKMIELVQEYHHHLYTGQG